MKGRKKANSLSLTVPFGKMWKRGERKEHCPKFEHYDLEPSSSLHAQMSPGCWFIRRRFLRFHYHLAQKAWKGSGCLCWVSRRAVLTTCSSSPTPASALRACRSVLSQKSPCVVCAAVPCRLGAELWTWKSKLKRQKPLAMAAIKKCTSQRCAAMQLLVQSTRITSWKV